MSQSVNKASEQTAAQAVAVVDARKGTIAERLAARTVVSGSRAGETALVGVVSFTNEALLDAFLNIARRQVQQLVIGIATLMGSESTLNVTEDVLTEIDAKFIKPFAKSKDNDVIGHYAAALLGQRGWGGAKGKDFINATRWAEFRRKHGVDDEFAILTVKRAKRVRS
jgi:hypothetical protein